MKALFRVSLLIFVFCATFIFATNSFAGCGDTQNERQTESDVYTCQQFSDSDITKTVYWNIYWMDSNVGRPLDVRDTGRLGWNTATVGTECTPACWPTFDSPYWVDDGTTASWYQKKRTGATLTVTGSAKLHLLPIIDNDISVTQPQVSVVGMQIIQPIPIPAAPQVLSATAAYAIAVWHFSRVARAADMILTPARAQMELTSLR